MKASLFRLALVSVGATALCIEIMRNDDVTTEVSSVERPLVAVDDGERTVPVQRNVEGEGPKHHRDIFGLWRLRQPGMYEKNHPDISTAFQEVVESASQSTVRVYCNDRVRALGTIVHAKGYVVTKASELRKGELICELRDGRRVTAKRIYAEKEYDLAVLRIGVTGLTAAQWHDGPAPPAGSMLATPGMDEKPIAIGVLSAGPRSIPSTSAVLGIQVEQASGGARVAQVFPNSGASRAGIRVDDVVTRVDDRPVRTRDGLVNTIRKYNPGDAVELVVRRGRTRLDVKATLGDWSNPHMPRLPGEGQNSLGVNVSKRRGGFPRAFQHDSFLEANECGGPIVDLDGKVVGINIARAGRVAAYAIPAYDVQKLLADMESRQ